MTLSTSLTDLNCREYVFVLQRLHFGCCDIGLQSLQQALGQRDARQPCDSIIALDRRSVGFLWYGVISWSNVNVLH